MKGIFPFYYEEGGGECEGLDAKEQSSYTAEECRAINRKAHRHLKQKPEEQLGLEEILGKDLFKERLGRRKE